MPKSMPLSTRRSEKWLFAAGLFLSACIFGCNNSDPTSDPSDPGAPMNLVYDVNSEFTTVLTGGVDFSGITPTVTGANIRYSVVPPLPTGLSINDTTGSISGTPTAISPATNYIVTASNSFGLDTTQVNIAVSWMQRSSGTQNSLTSILWTGSQFVAIGGSGAIVTSPDGVTWTSRTSGTTNFLTSVAWTGTQLVAVGNAGTTLTSPDGVTWTARSSGVKVLFNSVIGTSSQLVVVGDGGTILTSPDGVTWTARTSGVNRDLNSVVWTGSRFIALSDTGLLISANGINWSTASVVDSDLFGGGSYDLSSLVWTGTQLVILSEGNLLTSPDGVTWTEQFPEEPINFVTWTGHQLAAIGEFDDILTSSDGVTWKSQGLGFSFDEPSAITSSGNNLIVAAGGTGRTVVSITVTDTAPAISYKHAIITAIKNVAIAPDSTTSTGGAITSYAASTSTPLPAGLSLNNSIGIISGTPTAVTAGANDTIIAVGPGGTGKTVVTIAVADTAPSISYKHIIVGAVKNVAIIPDTAVSIGGAITSYAMSASTPLPAGLSLNNSTGIISGTPTIVTGAANDTVVAIGPGGTGKTVLSIAVADTSPAVSYKHVIIAAIRNAVIVPDSAVSIGGAITSYAMGISTPLPAGLSVNGVTGIISGTPTMVTTATNDTVIAAGPGGVGKAVVNIAVVDTAPAISYKRQTITAVRNVSLTPDTAVSVGGAITSYALGTSTPLPAGLSLNSVTGTISGTPTTVTTATNDTIIATGPGGIGKTLVSIAVLDTAPAIFYRHQTIAAVRNITIIPDTAISSGGAIASYAMAALTPLPAGLSLSTATGIISGIPTVITPVANDTILAMGPGGIGRAVLKITVTDTAPSIFYKLASIVAVKNAPIIPDTAISIGGSVSSFTMSLSTPLPAGLSLNSGTGIISGTPTTAAGASNDTVIAMGPGGTGKAVVSVTVNSVVAILDPYVVRLPGLNAFSFRVPEGSLSVRIMVQDIRGKTVWSREQAVGKNNLVSWDGGDSNGQSVPAGIYVVRLKLLDAEHNASEVRQVDALVP